MQSMAIAWVFFSLLITMDIGELIQALQTLKSLGFSLLDGNPDAQKKLAGDV